MAVQVIFTGASLESCFSRRVPRVSLEQWSGKVFHCCAYSGSAEAARHSPYHAAKPFDHLVNGQDDFPPGGQRPAPPLCGRLSTMRRRCPVSDRLIFLRSRRRGKSAGCWCIRLPRRLDMLYRDRPSQTIDWPSPDPLRTRCWLTGSAIMGDHTLT